MRLDDKLSTAQAAAHVGKTLKAFRAWKHRRKATGRPIPEYKLDGLCYFLASDLDGLYRRVDQPKVTRALSGTLSRAS
jgi:hypothetical protein